MTIGGVVSFVEDRENDFTHPRYAIIIGKISRSSITSLFQLVEAFVVALLLRIPLGGMDIVRLLLLSPILCLAGGALSICFISFVRDPKVAGMAHVMRNELLSQQSNWRESVLHAHRFASGSERLSSRQTEEKLS
jgi:ABC-2 type transport system permease protein